MSDRVFGARIHGEVEGSPVSVREQTLAIVRLAPEGRVVTYGWISGAMAGRISPVAVGWMLHRCPEDVPWHRVVNAGGRCSTDRVGDIPQGLQRAMLEAEGIRFLKDGSLKLDVWLWEPEKTP